MGRLRAILGYASVAAASLGVFAAFAITGVQNQAMAGPASYIADQVQAAPAYTAAPIPKSEPKAAVAPTVVAGPFIASISLYSVKSGDTLSDIAKARYGKAADWPVIYYANRKQISNPDLIAIGQTFRIPALPRHIPAAPKTTTPAVSTDTTAAVAVSPPSQQQTNYLTNGGGYSVTSAFQACVIRAESGGNPQIWNASGHWGLYQFSYSTWVAHGGDPSLFGKANGAYQTQIFWNTFNQDGTSDWAPYDGC